ncbi:uncharacterized protein [Nicotiana sylvestris]|uniref:uncharacterized protein n=1 Tax=Nicotiana sylvestris TaxID=4096 RepID=UPI00388C706A
MASTTTSLVALVLVVIATGLPAAHAFAINGQTVLGIQVSGTLACSTTGNLPGNGIVGVLATVTCNVNGTPTVLGIATTNLNGVFVALITNLSGLDPNTLSCVVRVNLPILTCSLLPRNGVLQAKVNLKGTVSQAIIGLVADATIGPFSVV